MLRKYSWLLHSENYYYPKSWLVFVLPVEIRITRIW